MNDLLGAVIVRSVSGHRPLGTADLELGAAYEPDAFLKQIDEIQNSLMEIENRQRTLKNLHERGKVIINSKEIQRHRGEMQDTVNGVNKLAHQVKKKLEVLEQDNENAKRSDTAGFSDQNRRKALTAALRTKLKDQMAAFATIRETIQEEYRLVVERRVYTVTGKSVSQDQIDHMIETGESENIFREAILQQGRPAVLATLAEIEERHKAAKDLEKGLMELNTLFLEMAVLVEEQGQQINDIEATVNRTTTFVQQGVTHLVAAKRSWRKSNQCKWTLAALIVLIIVILVLFILQPWNSAKK